MKPVAPIRALIVDDDASARAFLRDLVGAEPDIVIAGECIDGDDAVNVIGSSQIDLVFLDVQMPRLDGFDVLAQVGAVRMPPVIFISAYSEYAVRAFEAYALDYLLKPFDAARLAIAVERARDQVTARRAREASPALSVVVDTRLQGLLEHIAQAEQPRYPQAIAIRTGDQYAIIRVEDIDWIEAAGSYSRLYVNRRPRLMTKTLATLEKDVLDPDIFVRVHRSAIVNATKITTAEAREHGDLTLALLDGTRVECSRRYRGNLESKLYFTT